MVLMDLLQVFAVAVKHTASHTINTNKNTHKNIFIFGDHFIMIRVMLDLDPITVTLGAMWKNAETFN